MSSLGELIQQLANLDTFREMAELVKNPRQIVMAHDTARREMALTMAEESKMIEARKFMETYDACERKLRAEMDAFERVRKQHFSDMEEVVATNEAERIALEELRQELEEKEINLNEQIAIFKSKKK